MHLNCLVSKWNYIAFRKGNAPQLIRFRQVPNEHEAGSEFNRQPATAASDADTPDVEGGSELEDETSSGGEEPHEAAPSESKSFASTYWRPERTDRKGNLSAIDERCSFLSSGFWHFHTNLSSIRLYTNWNFCQHSASGFVITLERLPTSYTFDIAI